MLLSLGGPVVAGASTMAFSMIMFVLTDGWGLTSAIPLLFGGAMLFGVVAAYFIDDPSKRGDPVRIFTGVGILFVAVLLNTFATRCVLFVTVTVSMNNKDKQKKEETKSLLEEDHSADAMSSALLQSSTVPEVVASVPEAPAVAPEVPAVAPEVPAEKPVETAVIATTETPVPAAPEVPATAPASTTEGTQPSETSVTVTEEAPRKVGLCAFSDS